MSLSKNLPKVPSRLDTFGAEPDFEGASVPVPRSQATAPRFGQVLFAGLSTVLRLVLLTVVLLMLAQMLAPPLAASPLFGLARQCMHPFEAYAAPVPFLAGHFHWSAIAAVGSLVLAEGLLRVILRRS
ncbi:MAG: hypothetical protein ACYCW6_23640 [Candidatus Xenobia bacterium]